ELVAERVEQLADRDLGLPAVRTLVVAVLDERDRRLVRAADVVAVRIDVRRQVEQVVGGAGQLTRPYRGGQPLDQAEHGPGRDRRQERRGQHPDLRLLELPAVEGEA